MKKSYFVSTVLLLFGLAGAAFAAQAEGKREARADSRVDINTADVKELETLPGIGQQVAKRIVAYRDENGPFQKAEELMNVRGIGEKSFLKLQPHVTVGSSGEKKKK